MKKIGVAKYGQKVIFNRDSVECKRSNTNGNVGLYKMLKLLFENNKDTAFYMLSANDTCDDFVNVFNYAGRDTSELELDALFVVAGLGEYEKDEAFIERLNNIKAKKFFIISEDPRCTESMSRDSRLTRIPELIISQTIGWHEFKGRHIRVVYEPIQMSCCYGEKLNDDFVFNDELLLIANTSGENYDRPRIASELVKGIRFSAYGRLSESDKELLGHENCKGEVIYDEMIKIIRKSLFTLLIPIDRYWCTSKYVEALMNNCLPIFYEDYNTILISYLCQSLTDKYTIKSNEELEQKIDWIIHNYEEVCEDINLMKKFMVEPYLSGEFLSDRLMSYVERRMKNVK